MLEGLVAAWTTRHICGAHPNLRRNLHKAARVVVEKYNGQISGDKKWFKSLPGVGDYIAAAVLSIAFDLPLAVVDGNVKRVLARLFTMDFLLFHGWASHVL